MLGRHGFESLVAPRELWIDYLREKISRPGEVSAGMKRRLARWVARTPWVTESTLMRAVWDVSVGSNFFIARRAP